MYTKFFVTLHLRHLNFTIKWFFKVATLSSYKITPKSCSKISKSFIQIQHNLHWIMELNPYCYYCTITAICIRLSLLPILHYYYYLNQITYSFNNKWWMFYLLCISNIFCIFCICHSLYEILSFISIYFFTLIYFQCLIMVHLLVNFLFCWAVELGQFFWGAKANTRLYWFHLQNSHFGLQLKNL